MNLKKFFNRESVDRFGRAEHRYRVSTYIIIPDNKDVVRFGTSYVPSHIRQLQ